MELVRCDCSQSRALPRSVPEGPAAACRGEPVAVARRVRRLGASQSAAQQARARGPARTGPGGAEQEWWGKQASRTAAARAERGAFFIFILNKIKF